MPPLPIFCSSTTPTPTRRGCSLVLLVPSTYPFPGRPGRGLPMSICAAAGSRRGLPLLLASSQSQCRCRRGRDVTTISPSGGGSLGGARGRQGRPRGHGRGRGRRLGMSFLLFHPLFVCRQHGSTVGCFGRTLCKVYWPAIYFL